MENIPETKTFSLDEIVIFRDEIYLVTEVHILNWFSKDPFVYGIVPFKKKIKSEIPEVYVRSEFIRKASDSEVTKVLYGLDK